jgi:hypothetical protein
VSDTTPPRSSPSRVRGWRTVRAGLVTLGCSVLLLLSPLGLKSIGLSDLGKYFVAAGVIGACLGGTIAVNGLIDCLRGRG